MIEEQGRKGTEAHKAAVVGDTVGDPFKDTSGPSLNILLKLISVVALVIASSLTSPSVPSESSVPESELEMEYPYNIPWVNELNSDWQEWLILTEDKCEEIKGRAGEVQSEYEWKTQLWEKHCNN